LTTLYIRHPAKAEHDGAQCQFALVADGGALLQQGAGALAGMKDLVESCRKVVLLVAAADVTLLHVTVPPLSNARLKAALPSLVEDQILGDPADCVLVAAPAQSADGMRTIAVVQRSWLEAMVKALLAQGARSVSAVPAQLCLPVLPGNVSAVIGAHELTLRHALHEGMGLLMTAPPELALQTVRAMAGDMPVSLYVAASQLEQYQALAANASPMVTVEADHWTHWIAGSKTTALDLVAGLAGGGTRARDLAQWRWPLRIAALAVIVNLAGINIEWLRLKREADTVRQSMLQTFKAAYPKDPIQDPLLQMQRNVAAARASGGQQAADEFTAITAAFGEAARALGKPPAIATLEYRDHALTIKLKPESASAGAAAQLSGSLAQRGLVLTESAGNIWLVRSKTGSKDKQ
jgi:general secretion pathway protein L